LTIISIDAGGTRIKIGLVQNERIITRRTIPAVSGDGLTPRLPIIEQEVNQLLGEHGLSNDDLQGVGLSIPGIVDVKAMKVLEIHGKYDDVKSLNLQEWVKNTWGVSFVMEGDARSALTGAWQYGSGKGVNDLVLITLGTGIGTAVVMDGQVLYGKQYQAGILGGHFIIDQNGNSCNCGNVGCAESHASSWNLSYIAKQHELFSSSKLAKVDQLDFEIIFKLARQGDQCAIDLRDSCIDVWATTAINLIYAYDPELVLFAGGIMKSADVIIPRVQEKVNARGWAPGQQVRVAVEENLDDAALLGLAYLLKKRYDL
jgi:glucokinase